ncbi:MAG: DEAD/DEAH box helicase [Acidobacteriota bacterium]|nr:DEAD/DEAH box helicase [Acidobacteriota bacterium]
MYSHLPALPDPETYRRMVETYHRLDSGVRRVLQVMALLDEVLHKQQILDWLNRLGVLRDNGEPFDLRTLGNRLEELLESGLLCKTYSKTRPEVAQAAFSIIFRDVAGDAEFLNMSEAIDAYEANDMSYFRRDSFDRYLRIYVYTDQYPKLCALLQTKSSYRIPELELYKIAAFPVDHDWLARLSPPMRCTLLKTLLDAERAGERAPDLHLTQMLSAAGKDPGIEAWPDHAAMTAENLILDGKMQQAETLLQEAEGAWSEMLKGFLAFLKGDDKQALTLYANALKLERKETGSRRTFFRRNLGVFYLVVLVSTGKDARVKEALRLADATNYTHPHHNFYTGCTRMVEAVLDPKTADSYLGHIPSNGLIEGLVNVLMTYWLDPMQARELTGPLAALQERVHLGPYRWLKGEYADLLARLGHDVTRNRTRADVIRAEHGCRPLADALQLEPPWQRALTSLINIHNPEETQAKKGQIRLVWHIMPASGNCSIMPMRQTMGKNGRWGKPSAVPLKKIYEGDFEVTEPHDREICSHLVAGVSGNFARNRTISFDMRPALRAMIGHPLLFRADSPDERLLLEKAEPEVRVKTKQGFMEVTIFPPFRSRNTYLVHEETPTRLKFYEFNANHERIARILGPGLRVPPNGEEALLRAVGSLSESVVVNADLNRAAEHAVEGDSRIHVYLMPIGYGLKLRPTIRPFGSMGPAFRPGMGGALVFARVDGKTKAAKRDLDEENARLDELLNACPTMDAAPDDQGEWTLDEAEAAFTVLLELGAMGDRIVMAWPEGRAWRVNEARQKDLQLRVRKKTDWFEVSGALQVDEDLQLEMRQLLALTAEHGGRFIPLGEGRYLALTQTFRKRLEEIRLLTGTGAGSRIHPLASGALESLADEAGGLDTDKHWRLNRTRVREAFQLTPALPTTFQGELRDYQQEGFQWLVRLDHWGVGACLADDMGLGKTIQALAFMLSVAGQGPMLVVAPTSVGDNWIAEARRFTPTLKVHRYASSDRESLINEADSFDLVIATYGLLQQDAELLAGKEWRAVVLDEAQAVKNPGTKRARAARELKGRFKLITTGTPLENHLGELWSLFRFINPGLLGSREHFLRRYINPIEKENNHGIRGTLKKLVRPFILRRMKSQVLDELPPRTEIVLKVQQKPEERALYEAVRTKAIEDLAKKGEPGQIHILAEITRLRRACCNPRLIDPSLGLSGAKLELLSSILEELLESRHKALVFSQFVDHLTLIRDYLDKQGIVYQYLDGSTPAGKRQKRVDAFQSGEGDVFLISLKAGGTGLNLTAADYVIHMDPWWNPAVEDQASDRAHRIGQDRPVTVYRLVTQDTIEEKIVALHNRKRGLAESLLEGTGAAAKMNADELMTLIKQA